jgi:hypothetical protein
MIATERLEELRTAVYAHDYLQQLLGEIEALHRIVFHHLEAADWTLVRTSAEQIVVAELYLRFRGDVTGVREALKRREQRGANPREAVSDYAAAMHAYFTTPMGIAARRDLFGADAVFITPLALDWSAATKPTALAGT